MSFGGRMVKMGALAFWDGTKGGLLSSLGTESKGGLLSFLGTGGKGDCFLSLGAGEKGLWGGDGKAGRPFLTQTGATLR